MQELRGASGATSKLAGYSRDPASAERERTRRSHSEQEGEGKASSNARFRAGSMGHPQDIQGFSPTPPSAQEVDATAGGRHGYAPSLPHELQIVQPRGTSSSAHPGGTREGRNFQLMPGWDSQASLQAPAGDTEGLGVSKPPGKQAPKQEPEEERDQETQHTSPGHSPSEGNSQGAGGSRAGKKERSKPPGSMSSRQLPDDGYQWHKYGHKTLMDASFSRAYYRCAQRSQGCQAKKTVDFPLMKLRELRITYDGAHNHDPSTANFNGSTVVVRHKGQEGSEATLPHPLQAWDPPTDAQPTNGAHPPHAAALAAFPRDSWQAHAGPGAHQHPTGYSSDQGQAGHSPGLHPLSSHHPIPHPSSPISGPRQIYFSQLPGSHPAWVGYGGPTQGPVYPGGLGSAARPLGAGSSSQWDSGPGGGVQRDQQQQNPQAQAPKHLQQLPMQWHQLQHPQPREMEQGVQALRGYVDHRWMQQQQQQQQPAVEHSGLALAAGVLGVGSVGGASPGWGALGLLAGRVAHGFSQRVEGGLGGDLKLSSLQPQHVEGAGGALPTRGLDSGAWGQLKEEDGGPGLGSGLCLGGGGGNPRGTERKRKTPEAAGERPGKGQGWSSAEATQNVESNGGWLEGEGREREEIGGASVLYVPSSSAIMSWNTLTWQPPHDGQVTGEARSGGAGHAPGSVEWRGCGVAGGVKTEPGVLTMGDGRTGGVLNFLHQTGAALPVSSARQDSMLNGVQKIDLKLHL